MTYTVPAKTFLVGEYSALVGGSVLGLATGPGFEIHYSNEENTTPPFHLNSPAGMLWQENQLDLKNIKIEFAEKFNNLGGFGRSTAEYFSALIPLLIKKTEDFGSIRKQYQRLSLKSGAGASGADLAIQYFGYVTVIDSNRNNYSSSDWKLQDYDFILVSTGNKVKTHEHVAQLDASRLQSFPKISNPIVDLYLKGSAEEFILGLKEWSRFLISESLTHPFSIELKNQLEKNTDILCAKPCGAMGADVMLIICRKENTVKVQKSILAMNLVIQGTSSDLVHGICSQVISSSNQAGGAYVG